MGTRRGNASGLWRENWGQRAGNARLLKLDFGLPASQVGQLALGDDSPKQIDLDHELTCHVSPREVG